MSAPADNRPTEPGTPEARMAQPASADPRTASPFWPMLLLALALLGFFGFQTAQLWRERGQLEQALTALQPQVEAASRSRSAIDRLALNTNRMAEQGNANARAIVEELRRRGVTINPDAPAAAPPGR
jgi:hypothetical protein